MMKSIYAILMLLTSVGSVVLAQQLVTQQQSVSQTTVAKVKRVCIVGNVVKPSEITFTNSLTVTQAITKAGGLLRGKKSTEVVVYSAMIGAGTRAIYVDLKKIEKHPYKDMELQDYDTLYAHPLKRAAGDIQMSNPCPSWPVFKNSL